MLAIAHRGYSESFPENTALAFEKAIEAGADFIETDVRITRDGELVCWHDPGLQRITGIEQPVADLTLEAIKAIPLAMNQRVPALADVLAIARGRAGVMLDVKVPTGAMIEAVTALLDRTGMAGNVVYGARTIEHLTAVRKRCPSIALLGMPASPSEADAFIERAVRGVRFWEDEVTPDRVRRVRDAGREVWVTAGQRGAGEPPGHATKERLAALIRMGVSAVLVNDPGLVKSAEAMS